MEQNEIKFSDIRAMLGRRKMHLLVPFVLVLTVATSLAFGLPPIYQSMATILIEQQEIPQELVSTTVTGYAAERIEIISQRILTSASLNSIVKKFKLFEEGSAVDNAKQISKVRENINIEMVSADVRDKKGKSRQATIAFNVSFDSESQQSALEVTQELVSLYLQENQRLRTEKAEVTSEFLAQETRKLSEKISTLEAQLARYKERNLTSLPEMTKLNMGILERTERELDEAERNLATLEVKKASLNDQITHTDPFTGASPSSRLRELQVEYLRKASSYSPKHPDMVKLHREITILKNELGATDDTEELINKLHAKRQQLAQLKKHETDSRKIAMLEEDITSLETGLYQAANELSQKITKLAKPDNPAYLAIESQIKNIDIQISAEREKVSRMNEKMARYEERVVQAPRVEQEGLALNRDYDNAIKKYRELKEKQMRAELAEELEKDSRAERFLVIEPPRLPASPIKPNRLGIFLLGLTLALAAGISVASIAEYTDHTIRGSNGVIRALGVPPLTVIPYVK